MAQQHQRKPTKFLRLKDNHATMGKLHKLMELAEELGIWLEFDQNYCLLHDRDREDTVFRVYDLDHEDEAVSDFPPALDFKVLMDNPAYTEWQKQEAERVRLQAEEASRVAEAKRKKQREEAELRRQEEARLAAIALEQKERAELARLKTKYEG